MSDDLSISSNSENSAKVEIDVKPTIKRARLIRKKSGPKYRK